MLKTIAEDNTSESSLDSWTVLDPESPEIEPLRTTITETLQPQNTFLTFEEYFQERIMDDEHPAKEPKKKISKKPKFDKWLRRNRCKTPKVGITLLMAITITLIGFAALCSTLSQPPPTLKPSPMPKRTDFVVLAPKKHRPNSLDAIMEDIRKMNEITAKNRTLNSTETVRAELGPMVRPKRACCTPKMDLPRRETKLNSSVVKKNDFDWNLIKKFVLNPNIHALVSLFVTNFYLFSLLLDIARKEDVRGHETSELGQLIQELEKEGRMDKINKLFLKELPYYGRKMDFVGPRNKRIGNNGVGVRKAPVFEFTASPSLAKMAPGLVPALVSKIESGKSECQKRFDELDMHQKRFDQLKQNQRNRVKLLKQKYRNEIALIRNGEVESLERAEKINATSKKFIRKLKGNREKYLLEMRKTRRGMAKKDATTGIYDVAIPKVFDFGTKKN